MATIAVYSLKGGVGKTSLAVNLAWCAATQSSRRTLLWDLDAQAAATFLLSKDYAGKDSAQAAFAKDLPPAKLVRPTSVERLDLIGADTSLRSLDRFFFALDKKKRLARLISDLDKRYDRIILDCPPGLTETSDQIMRAADIVVVPVIPSPLSRRALDEVIEHLDCEHGGHASILPVFSMLDRRRLVHRDALSADAKWPVIPMASVVEQMSTHRAPLGAFAPRSPAALAISTLWQGIERRLAKTARTK
ncbi:MAG: ParA family protein [Alphaproteobacteria bacterium]|nr:ParA family protein [Alphaproteobacteria bacterium]MDE2340032.1 ParA family protein [Alphaproteobacteria bacterium]